MQVHLLDMAVVGDDGAALMVSGMKLHTVGIVLLVAVAVDTLSLGTLGAEHIVVDDAFVIVLEAALADGEILVDDVGRRYETIADVGVDGIARHIDEEWLETCPVAVLVDIDLDLDGRRLSAEGRQDEPPPLAMPGCTLLPPQTTSSSPAVRRATMPSALLPGWKVSGAILTGTVTLV